MKVLIAEDERITRRSLQRELERWGHRVTAVEDGCAAWEAFLREPFDMVVTDWDMPRMDGRELIQRIRARDGSTYVYLIMLTGRSEKPDLVAGMEAGADDFLAKPFDREELRVRLSAGARIIHLERRLAEQNQTLLAVNEKMHLDLRAAARVQQQLLPTSLPDMRGLRFAWRYRPCDELGGDLLNIVPFDECRAAMYLADVSGHGVAASLVSVSVHRSLSVREDRSSIIVTDGGANGGRVIVPPEKVAGSLNSIYTMDSSGGHYLTLVYALVDAASRTLTYCAAGHPGPAVAKPGRNVQSLESTGFPVGWVPDAEYSACSLQLVAGDRVYLYSDGLMEATNPDGVMFGRQRIESIISDRQASSLDTSIDALVDEALAWRRSDRFDDDLSILAMEVCS